MSKRKKLSPGKVILLTMIGFVLLIILSALLIGDKHVVLFDPKGFIANEQKDLLINSTLVMLVIAIPSLILFYFFAWRYREDNTKSDYSPNSVGGKGFVFMIWAIPSVFVVVLIYMMVPATHKLVPQKNIGSDNEKITIQVVGLRWKWLFIYPEHNIASVNFVQFPEDTPIEFELTVDETPMSSFWIPSLGGQLYAMTEHVNKLNLISEETGDFEGKTAEINGSGFAGMKFNARVSSEKDYEKWLEDMAKSPNALTDEAYKELLRPSENNVAAFFTNPNPDRFMDIVNKYGGSHSHGSGHEEIETYEVYEGAHGH